jgi:hypothetical protein
MDMKAYLTKVEGEPVVWIQARAVGPGRMVGDMVHEVREGEKYGDYTYEELVELASTKGYIVFPPTKKKKKGK